MLNRLYIQNYALIDSLDIRFGEGLNMLTGETGAGKSIIMGALSLIMGQRAENRFLYDQEKKCVIEGYFSIARYGLEWFFEEHDLDFDAETIIRREFGSDGKSRAFINDTPVTLAVLKRLSEQLIDIHSQHATLQIADADFQLLVLDRVAGNQEIRKDYTEVLHSYKKTVSELDRLIRAAEAEAAEADYKTFLFNELEQANLDEGEATRLEEERDQLEHAEDIQRSMQEAIDLLRTREDSAEQLLHRAAGSLERAGRFMPFLEEQAARLRSSLIEVNDIADEIEGKASDIQLDERRLQFVHDRLGQLYGLQKKHNLGHADELIRRRDELGEQLGAMSNHQDVIEQTRLACRQMEKELTTLSETLRQTRMDAIPAVQEQVLTTLRQVGMPDSRLQIELRPLAPLDFREDGNDSISFQFSSNRGQALQSVGKVASGGELSRLMLAVKTLVAHHSALPSIIFDEIDAGISGEVALRVGDVLEQMGERMQVIVISHLPQIASRKAVHYRVYKTVTAANRTTTNIQLLSEEDRVQEIAQMLSGAEPGEAALDHARTLLQRPYSM